MRVVISNTVALNGGDAAILFSIRKVLRDHLGDRLNLTIFDSQPEVASRLYPDLDFQQLLYEKATLRRECNAIDNRYLRYLLRESSSIVNPLRIWLALYLWRYVDAKAARRLLTDAEWQSLQVYASADVIISTGGTYLVDYYFLEPRIFDYQLALFFGKPLVFYTQTLGPFHKPKYRKALGTIFNRADLAFLREEASIENLRDIGVTSTPLIQAADAVFSLAEPSQLEAARTKPYPTGERPHVAISVRHWPHFKHVPKEEGMANYKKQIAAAATHLVEDHNARVTFVSTCQGVREYRTDDAHVARQIVSMLPDAVREHVHVDADFHPPTQLKEQLTQYDFVIATRMHMAILSLTAGTPVLPIAYEEKTTHMFEKMDLVEWVTDIEFIGSDFSDRVDAFIQNIDTLRAKQIDGTLSEYAQAQHAAESLQEKLSVLEAPAPAAA